MKKIILFLALIPIALFAQEGEWFPLPSDQISYFTHGNNNANGTLMPYHIDSIISTNSGNYYYNIRTPEVYHDEYDDGYLHDPYASWLGSKSLINNNEAWFYNKHQEPIYLPYNKDLNQNWRMYEYSDGSYIEAWFSEQENAEIVEGLFDDVKYINFQFYAADGSVMESQINSDILILSKNYGFIKTYRWYNFPDQIQYQKFRLQGIEIDHQYFGFKWDYDETITSYEIGDIIHLQHDHNGEVKDEYLAKKQMPDYVEYDIKRTSANYQSMEVNKVRFDLGNFPGQSLFNDEGHFTGFKKIRTSSQDWNGRKIFMIQEYNDYQAIEYEGTIYYYREPYISNSGYPTNVCHDVHYYADRANGDGELFRIVYFKNKDEEFGNPINLDVNNYQAVRPDLVTYYDNKKAIRIDSIKDGAFGVKNYYSYNTLELYEYYNDGEDYLYDPNTSWVGKEIRILDNGMNVFFDKYNRAIRIQTKAKVKDEWELINYPNGDRIMAFVTGKEYQLIFKNTYDSVKIIQCQAFHANGSQMSHSINYQSFRLSKNYGMLDMPKFYNFYSGNSPYASISGIRSSYQHLGRVNYYQNIINSVEVGDQLQYQYFTDDYGYNINRSVIGKVIEGKLIKYIYKSCVNTFGYGNNTTNTFDEIVDTIIFPTNILPHEIVFASNADGNSFSFQMWNEGATELCESYPHFSYEYIENRDFVYEGKLLWKIPIDDSPHWFTAHRWAKDIGWYIFDRGAYDSPDYLDYFESDGEYCGEPHEFTCDDVSVDIEEFDIPMIDIKPNPSNGVFTLTSQDRILELDVYNSQGGLISQQIIDFNEGRINISNHPSGIYLIKIKLADGNVISKKMILQH